MTELSPTARRRREDLSGSVRFVRSDQVTLGRGRATRSISQKSVADDVSQTNARRRCDIAV